jgi:transmembrane sensor
MSPELAAALEALRSRPVVSESREQARLWTRRRRLRRLWLPVLGAATVLVLLGLGLSYLPRTPAATELVTAIGETRSVTLEEGSRIVLDARSRIRVRLGVHAREIELLDGQAQFEVAHDRERPFRVRTGQCEIVAVGTRFTVARLPASTTVTLIEGQVQVRTLAAGASRLPVLAPGQQLQIASDGQLLDEKPVELESVTAWQRGSIVLDDLPLTDALAVLNRYSATQIVIHGALLQDRRISGVFRAGDVDTEALVLKRYFGLKESSRSVSLIVLEQG